VAATEKEFGEHGQRICDRVFWAWEIYQHTLDRRELALTIRALQREFKPIARRYAGKARATNTAAARIHLATTARSKAARTRR
jgi:uncharacterized membrane protein YccC